MAAFSKPSISDHGASPPPLFTIRGSASQPLISQDQLFAASGRNQNMSAGERTSSHRNAVPTWSNQADDMMQRESRASNFSAQSRTPHSRNTIIQDHKAPKKLTLLSGVPIIPKVELQCAQCDKFGHAADQCSANLEGGYIGTKCCAICNTKDHITKHCPSITGDTATISVGRLYRGLVRKRHGQPPADLGFSPWTLNLEGWNTMATVDGILARPQSAEFAQERYERTGVWQGREERDYDPECAMEGKDWSISDWNKVLGSKFPKTTGAPPSHLPRPRGAHMQEEPQSARLQDPSVDRSEEAQLFQPPLNPSRSSTSGRQHRSLFQALTEPPRQAISHEKQGSDGATGFADRQVLNVTKSQSRTANHHSLHDDEDSHPDHANPSMKEEATQESENNGVADNESVGSGAPARNPFKAAFDAAVDAAVLPKAKELAQELAKDIAKEMAMEMAQDMASEMAKEMAKEMAVKLAEEMAEKMVEDKALKMFNDFMADQIEPSSQLTTQSATPTGQITSIVPLPSSGHRPGSRAGEQQITTRLRDERSRSPHQARQDYRARSPLRGRSEQHGQYEGRQSIGHDRGRADQHAPRSPPHHTHTRPSRGNGRGTDNRRRDDHGRNRGGAHGKSSGTGGYRGKR